MCTHPPTSHDDTAIFISNTFRSLEDEYMTYMMAGTKDRFPFLLKKIPSRPPAHHRTPYSKELAWTRL